MRYMIRDQQGTSVIVGALLLTLVVITAAASFAIFVSQKQKEIQQHELFNLKREQENIHVLNIVPQVNSSTHTTWGTLNCTVASLHAEASLITQININDKPLKNFSVWRFNTSLGKYENQKYTYSDRFELLGREQVTLFINLSTGFFEDHRTFLTTDFIKIEIFTEFLNFFSRVFIPPNVLIKTQTESLWDADKNRFEDFTIFDGSESDHLGDGYIIRWEWTFNNSTMNYSCTKFGRKVTAPQNMTEPGVYLINLVVTDNYGMVGTDSIRYELVIRDTTSPVISDVAESPDPQEPDGYVNISCTVTDTEGIHTVTVNITYPNTSQHNETMVKLGTTTYYFNTTYSQPGDYTYFIWANDTSDNRVMSGSYTFIIYDTTPPMITNVTDVPNPQEVDGYVNISCDVTDNVAVNEVMVNISGPGGFTSINASMSMSSSSYYYTIKYGLVGTYTYFIWANDANGNSNTSNPYTFTILSLLY